MAALNYLANMDRRIAPATRTRLRGGIILDMKTHPICECTLYDLENGDIGIILPDPELEIAATFYIQDNKDLFVALVQSHWRMGPHLGIGYLEPPVPLSRLGQMERIAEDDSPDLSSATED